MRYITDFFGAVASPVVSMVSWSASWFYSQAPVQEPKETIFLDLCKADYFFRARPFTSNGLTNCTVRPEEDTLREYFVDKRFKEDGYTAVRLHNFDFTQPDCVSLVSLIKEDFVLVQSQMNLEQLWQMLRQEVPLDRSCYRLIDPISFENYAQLYEFCQQNDKVAHLHGVPVDFSNSDVTPYPDNFVASCCPIILENTVISQQQFNQLLSGVKINRPYLNLRGLVLRDLILDDLIEQHQLAMTLKHQPACWGQKKICLPDTSISGAILSLDVLALLAQKKILHEWFDEASVDFTLRFENGIRCDDYVVNINRVLVGVEAVFLQSSKANRLMSFSKTTFSQRLLAFLKEKKLISGEVPTFQMKKSEQFLWLMYCVKHYEQAPVSRAFWQYLSESYKSESQVTLRQ